MWEEFLKKKTAGGMAKLVALGWDVVDQAEDRVKFDVLCERFAEYVLPRSTPQSAALMYSLQRYAAANGFG